MDQNTQTSLDNDREKHLENFLKMEDLLSNYSDDILKKIFNEEYLPWVKTGILEDGELRNIDNEYREIHRDLMLIVIERAFLLECAKRFINL